MQKRKSYLLKALAVAMMLVLSLTILAGCGKKEENGDNKSSESTTKQEKKEISKGKWEDNVYTSEFAGLKFKLPEGWNRSTDEEIAEVMNLGKEVLEDEGLYSSKITQLTTVYDMMAKNPTTNGSIAIMMEKTSAKETLYANSLKKQLEAVTQMKYNIGEFSEKTICGNKYTVVPATINVSGQQIFQNYYIRSVGDYMVAILVTETSEANVNNLMNCFE